MSIHTITCDDFIMLNAAHHKLAIRLFTVEINALIKALALDAEPTAASERLNDELLQAMQLRKLHQVRLDEMAEDEELAPKAAMQRFEESAMQRFEENERQILAA